MEAIMLDGALLTERTAAMDILTETLSLPEWWGRNLDALYDCITEMSGCSIKLLHLEEAGLEGTYGAGILKVLEEGAAQNPGFTVKKI